MWGGVGWGGVGWGGVSTHPWRCVLALLPLLPYYVLKLAATSGEPVCTC